ncbi:unnamed protein product [Thelazia callipaeda]|uniref:C-mannosyltransferase dpy-19 n=1 Tax=Thelazia callipaeda TaxID=103827 RepID=A0A0N5CYZ6_THECL|nr:unnamed protein product [Thelazia callipaeda]
MDSPLKGFSNWKDYYGLYYSYYKKLVREKSFLQGLKQITNDNETEYGHTINSLKRFNIYPEVFIAIAFKYFRNIADKTNWVVEQCWLVNRGESYSSVTSCDGIGNEQYFYVISVFSLASTVASSIFLLAYTLSETVLGGLLAVCCFFFNHNQATRVHWTPPLRESFGYPVFIAQMLTITYILKHLKVGFRWSLLIAFFTTAFMIFWQFSAFALATEMGSLFATFILDFIPIKTMNTIVRGHAIAFLAAFIMLFGNEMLLASFYMSTIVTLLIIVYMDRFLYHIKNRLLYIFLNIVLFVVGTIGIKVALSLLLRVKDDAHIMDLLRAKFTSFANFHTRLYTCTDEFNFIGKQDLMDITTTLLLPSAVLSFFLVFLFLLQHESLLYRNKIRIKPCSEIVYNSIQCVCFIIMASIIMRLKLFMNPHLCIITALLTNHEFVAHVVQSKVPRWVNQVLIVALLSAMAYKGKMNIQKVLGVQGEYGNPSQEALFQWVLEHTKSDSVFAGPMPDMANLKLSTGRPIVNHPHYEDAGQRERTYKVYSILSRKPIKEVYHTLKQMGVNYYIFRPRWCDPSHSLPNCTFQDIWDLVDPANRKRESLCKVIMNALIGKTKTLPLLKVVYMSQEYVVFKL